MEKTRRSVDREWRIIIPEVTPTANVFMRLHWADRKRMQTMWRNLLISYGVRDIPKAIDRKRTVLVYRYSKGSIDYANCFLGIDKLILDNLVHEGVLVDDSDKWLNLIVVPRRAKTRERGMKAKLRAATVIEILSRPDFPVSESVGEKREHGF
jgi:hypothetical protein